MMSGVVDTTLLSTLFKKEERDNCSSFTLLADICKLQVLSNWSNSKCENAYHLKGLLVHHWEIPSTLSEVKTQLKIVFYNFFKILSSLLTDCALFSTRIYIFLLDFT